MSLKINITQVREQITEAALDCKRLPEDICLLAASKNQSPLMIEKAYFLGIANFGENYYQEALLKIQKLHHLAIDWHFIGAIQRNKTAGIAQHFNWVHSIDRIKIAEHLNYYRRDNPQKLNVCVQINLANEHTKSGVSIEEAKDLVLTINQLPHLKLRGLMSIPKAETQYEKQLSQFKKLQQTMSTFNKELNFNLDTLSMGMSHDFESAIHAGATIIRIGQAIFGERQNK